MDELKHFGIKGMRWGIRRFQRKDGSLTPAGKKRYADDSDSGPDNTSKKKVSEMSYEELQQAVSRLTLEKRYRELNPAKISKGKAVMKHISSQILIPAATEVGKQLFKEVLNDSLGKARSKQIMSNMSKQTKSDTK